MDYALMTDIQLVNRLAGGDKSAFSAIYERYWLVLRRHALRMLQDEEETKDVLQEVFSTLWDKAEQLQFTTSLSSFLYASVRNRILNIIKHRKVAGNYFKDLGAFIEQGHVTADAAIREKQLAQRIEEEIALLPEKMRQVFELSRKHHLSYQQISEELNITEHTVRKQMSNALKQLRLKLGSLCVVFFL